MWTTSSAAATQSVTQITSSGVAAIFDLDNTLLTESSGRMFYHYLRHTDNFRRYFNALSIARVVSSLLLYRLRVISAEQAMDQAVAISKGIDVAEMWGLVERWFEEMVVKTISSEAIARLEWHRSHQHTPVICSASSQFSVLPVATHLQIDHAVYSEWLVDHGKLSGQARKPYAYGLGKVTLMSQWANTHQIDLNRSYFYSDHHSDLPLLEAVAHPHVVNPSPKLRTIAIQRKWSILEWR